VVRRAALAVTLAALAALTACDAAFTPQFRVDGLRLLSIRAEVADTAPPTRADVDLGEVLRLSAIVAAPAGAPDLRVEWFACVPRAGETVPPCLDPSALRDLAAFAATPGVLRLGEGTSIEVPVPAELQPAVDALVARAEERPEFACTLYVEVPVVAVASAGGVVRTAVKPARVAPRATVDPALAAAYVPNLNPRIAAVASDPADEGGCTGGVALDRPCASDADCAGSACRPVASGPGVEGPVCDDPLPRRPQRLCASPERASSQTLFQCEPGGTRFAVVEELRWQWYVTGGTLDTGDGGIDVGNATDRTLTFTPPDGPFTLWLILRDGRGGEDWIRRDFR
jgi:hypothetical protein